MECTNFLRAAALAVSLLSGLPACQPVLANRGNLLEGDRVAQITPGASDQAQVQAILGPPTTIGTFDNKLWYYSGKRTERTAFFDPETLEQRTIAIRFDDDGKVASLTDISPDTQVAIAPEARRTPTVGEAMSIADQIRESLSSPGLPGSIGSKKPGQVSGPGG